MEPSEESAKYYDLALDWTKTDLTSEDPVTSEALRISHIWGGSYMNHIIQARSNVVCAQKAQEDSEE